MDENEVQRLMQDNYKYIRALREIVMSKIEDHSSYKDMVKYIQGLAHESVGNFEVRKYE